MPDGGTGKMTQRGLTPEQIKRLKQAQQRMDGNARADQQTGGHRRFEPKALSDVLQSLLVAKGFGRKLGAVAMEKAWEEVLGPEKSAMTRLGQVRRGVLNVVVGNSPLLSELTHFYKPALLKSLKQSGACPGLTDIRFRLGSLDEK
jgi:hypothetical protein